MKLKKIEGINVVPLIDIMLVLLVMVLTTATFIAQGQIPVTLPKVSSEKVAAKNSETHELTITREGGYYLDGRLASLSEIEKSLVAFSKESPLFIRADAQANFESFALLVGLLQRKGFYRLSINTEKSSS